jgi:hypothetical protein
MSTRRGLSKRVVKGDDVAGDELAPQRYGYACTDFRVCTQRRSKTVSERLKDVERHGHFRARGVRSEVRGSFGFKFVRFAFYVVHLLSR